MTSRTELPPQSPSGDRQEARAERRLILPRELFRETKKAHLALQEQGGQQSVWSWWYAEYVKARVQETDPQAAQAIDMSRLVGALEQAEYAHNADWPEFFSVVLAEHLNGRAWDGEISEFVDHPAIDALRTGTDQAIQHSSMTTSESGIDIIALANLLKEIKVEHIKAKDATGQAIPWAPWYAAALAERLRDRVDAKMIDRIAPAQLEHVLEQAEELHVAEWPQFYSEWVPALLSGDARYTPEETEEFASLQLEAQAAGRIEQMPDQEKRRRYLALMMKGFGHHRAPSVSMQHAPDPLPAETPRAENLTDEELRARAETRRQIEAAVDAWIAEHIPKGEEFTQMRLGQLVEHLGRVQAELFSRLTDQCQRRDKYIDRPAIKVYDGKDGKTPDIWVLGWRQGETGIEETAIHDHADSTAAFHVFRGTAEEHIYAFDASQFNADGTLKVRVLPFQQVERSLLRGSTATIPAPYIHRVRGTEHDEFSVTIHAYYPPLDRMNLYAEAGDTLVHESAWEEQRAEHC